MGILVSIISYSKLLGNYNKFQYTLYHNRIISYSKLLGNYNPSFFNSFWFRIISYSKLLGNYNILLKSSNIIELYHILNY